MSDHFFSYNKINELQTYKEKRTYFEKYCVQVGTRFLFVDKGLIKLKKHDEPLDYIKKTQLQNMFLRVPLSVDKDIPSRKLFVNTWLRDPDGLCFRNTDQFHDWLEKNIETNLA